MNVVRNQEDHECTSARDKPYIDGPIVIDNAGWAPRVTSTSLRFRLSLSKIDKERRKGIGYNILGSMTGLKARRIGLGMTTPWLISSPYYNS